MSGMYISALGNVFAVAECSFWSVFFRVVVSVWSLLFIPKDRMIFSTSSLGGVLLRMMCVAWAKLAPGKQSICSWSL